jgi:hypothetical protein
MGHDRNSSVLIRVAWGALIGAAFALGVMVIDLVRVLGGLIADSAPTSGWRPTMQVLVGIVVSGALGGWLLPYCRRKWTAAAVGLVVIQPFLAGMMVSLPGFTSRGDAWIFWCIQTLLFGPAVGVFLVRDYLVEVIGLQPTQ